MLFSDLLQSLASKALLASFNWERIDFALGRLVGSVSQHNFMSFHMSLFNPLLTTAAPLGRFGILPRSTVEVTSKSSSLVEKGSFPVKNCYTEDEHIVTAGMIKIKLTSSITRPKANTSVP